MGCRGSKTSSETDSNNARMNGSEPLSPQPTTSRRKPGKNIVIALYSYEGRNEEDLCFEKGEKLIVLDDKEPDWWLAQKLETQEKGYIPNNFVVFNTIETEEWFFSGVSRREAERLLLSDDYSVGTFLIRHSEHGSGSLALSIRDLNSIKLDHVKHYKIRQKCNGEYYITCRRSFTNLSELVAYYSQSPSSLCCLLLKPCPRFAQTVGPSIRSHEINRNDLEMKRELGTGNFGKVYYGLFRGQTEVAIKTLKHGTMTPSAFLQEAVIMRKCRHKQLVSLYGVCSVREPLLIITEYMCNGSLLDYLKNNPEGRACTMTDLIDMIAQIVSGMAFLESTKLVHRDLAARNVLVGKNKTVKVADFGLARMINEDAYIAQGGAKLPLKWTAPEAITSGMFTSKSDVWSFGILLYEIVTKGEMPYPGMNNLAVIDQVQRGYRMSRPTHVECPDNIFQLMLKCWHERPDKRPTFESLRNYFDDNEQRYDDVESMMN